MTEKKENKVVKYRLKAIEILDEKLESHPDSMGDIKNFNFKINVEQKINNEKKLVISAVEVFITSDNESMHLGSIKVGCIFEVENIELFYNTKTTKVSFPKEFDTTLIAISLSTARGVMFSQFKGTFLHNAVLPVIDMKSFMPVDKEISKNVF